MRECHAQPSKILDEGNNRPVSEKLCYSSTLALPIATRESNKRIPKYFGNLIYSIFWFWYGFISLSQAGRMNNNDTKKKIIQGEYKKLILHNEIYETTEYSGRGSSRTGIFWVIQKKTPEQNARAMPLPAWRENIHRWPVNIFSNLAVPNIQSCSLLNIKRHKIHVVLDLVNEDFFFFFCFGTWLYILDEKELEDWFPHTWKFPELLWSCVRIDLGDANEGLGNLKKKIFSPDISERSENSQQAIEVWVHQRDKKKIQ